jgi:hypothetical protein
MLFPSLRKVNQLSERELLGADAEAATAEPRH